ncbi:endonuclease/exonuclease/phosphatase family protein [Streptomyces sp. S1A]|uniref:endonuclease/exonuclease/phosphatase family protein n=1 Tax=Streptomyces sp. ICN903 TaxID=2964654 RepID=UPI001EDAC478|nr:endonuclease/exonuclease/phosphatase family protein [Streptomyces sp. ICN903]MCG3038996.1 endonuclease/exonuclease/phosphatase family protein [Streptomyces sp. ICN903]
MTHALPISVSTGPAAALASSHAGTPRPDRDQPTAPDPAGADEVRFLSWNVRKGTYVKQACEWIDERMPDVVMWQEFQRADRARIEDWLGMETYLAPPLPGSSNDNAILVRPGGPLAVTAEYEHRWAPWHAPANIEVRLHGDGGALSRHGLFLVSKHDCYWSALPRQIEADWLTTLAKPGRLALIMGDWSGFPAGTDIDWKAVEDRAFYVNHTYLDGNGIRRTDDRADRTTTDAEFVDPARWAADRLGQPRALDPTTGYGPDKIRQAGPTRTDRAAMSAELAAAITRFAVGDPVEHPELDWISDHRPLELFLDRRALHMIVNRAPARS